MSASNSSVLLKSHKLTMSNPTKNLIIREVAGSIDIPDSAYEKATARYRDLGEWFGRKESHCHIFNPHIYPQGSFRLGTVIRPVDADGEYDLDMGCRLRAGITKATHTQEQLKTIVGADLEDYRIARGIKEKKEEKHRCWRLKYADALNFHLDTVPSIPESSERQLLLKEAILKTGTSVDLATLVANLTGAITDNRLSNYRRIDDAWRLSNSEGFALWFESRMKLATALMASIALKARVTKVDALPTYRWKSPLQLCVQLLKRHRDVMFANDPDSRPPSVIITTLSALAYRGETDIGEALDTILSGMETFIRPTTPRVPNPVNPAEDFADKWSDPASNHLNLELKFRGWLNRAKVDFNAIGEERNAERIIEATKEKYWQRTQFEGSQCQVGHRTYWNTFEVRHRSRRPELSK